VTNEHSSTSTAHQRPLIALLAASGLASFGNIVTLIVVPWFVLQLTGSAAKTGLVGFAAALPLVLAGIFGGVLIDRLGYVRSAVLAEVFSGLMLALIPILHLAGALSFWHVLVLVFLSNLCSAPGMTARRSQIPEAARPAGVPLERANSIDQVLTRAGVVFAPPLAGVLVAAFDAILALWVTVAAIWLSALAMSFGSTSTRALAAPAERASYLGELLTGLRFVLADPLIRTVVAILAVTNFLEAPLSIIAPVYADRVLGGAVDLGLMFAALGVGLVIGAGSFGWIGHRLPRRLVFCVGFIGIGALYWVLSITPGLPVVIVALFLMGVMAGPINPLLATISQERVPAEMRGRVFGLTGAIAFSMIPAGRLLGGYLIEAIGLSGLTLIIAILFALVGVMIVLAPGLRKMENPRPATAERDLTVEHQVSA
jgi:MFS family permease